MSGNKQLLTFGTYTNIFTLKIYDGLLSTSHSSGGEVPPRALQAGWEANGTPLYAALVNYGGGRHPGKMCEGFGGCNFALGDREVNQKDCEVSDVLAWRLIPGITTWDG